jgi:hypothetical protein
VAGCCYVRFEQQVRIVPPASLTALDAIEITFQTDQEFSQCDYQTKSRKEGGLHMWKKTEGKTDDLLKEVCGDDGRLREFLGGNLCENPLTAIPADDLDTLVREAERSGNYRPALDKAVFEGSQHLADRDKYVKVIRDVVSRAIDATEKEKEMAVKQGLTARAASLETRIQDQKFMNERAGDIIEAASRFYAERLVALDEEGKKEVRARDRRVAEGQERKIEDRERVEHEARKKEIRGMGGQEKKEAEKQDKIANAAAEERKKAIGQQRVKAEAEEKRIADLEKSAQEARTKERRGK